MFDVSPHRLLPLSVRSVGGIPTSRSMNMVVLTCCCNRIGYVGRCAHLGNRCHSFP